MHTFQFLDTRAQSQVWYQCKLFSFWIPEHNHKFDINAIFPILGYPPTKISLISMQSFQFSDTRAQPQVWYQCNLSSSWIPEHNYKFDINAIFPILGYPHTNISLIWMQTSQFLDTREQSEVLYQCNFSCTQIPTRIHKFDINAILRIPAQNV